MDVDPVRTLLVSVPGLLVLGNVIRTAGDRRRRLRAIAEIELQHLRDLRGGGEGRVLVSGTVTPGKTVKHPLTGEDVAAWWLRVYSIEKRTISVLGERETETIVHTYVEAHEGEAIELRDATGAAKVVDALSDRQPALPTVELERQDWGKLPPSVVERYQRPLPKEWQVSVRCQSIAPGARLYVYGRPVADGVAPEGSSYREAARRWSFQPHEDARMLVSESDKKLRDVLRDEVKGPARVNLILGAVLLALGQAVPNDP